jgi:hypothetical protein
VSTVAKAKPTSLPSSSNLMPTIRLMKLAGSSSGMTLPSMNQLESSKMARVHSSPSAGLN